MKTNFLSLLSFIAILFITSFNSQAQTKTIELFNGINLDGWGLVVADPAVNTEAVFMVKDGVIHIVGEPFGYMYTDKVYTNFQLHVEWRWPSEGTNSGIFLYVQDDKKVWPNTV